MNDLSLLLYLADTLPRISDGCAAGAVVLGTTIVVYTIVRGVSKLSSTDDLTKRLDENTYNQWKKVDPFDLLKNPLIWVALFFLLTVSALIPEKETIYLIAGSEAGETVVTSEAGQEIISDIREVIDYQLNSLKGE